MNNIMKFEEVLNTITPNNGFLQVAQLFASVNKMEMNELIVLWQTLKHFEAIHGTNNSLINLKKSVILAIAHILRIHESPSGVTIKGSPYQIMLQKAKFVINGEDVKLFGSIISPLWFPR